VSAKRVFCTRIEYIFLHLKFAQHVFTTQKYSLCIRYYYSDILVSALTTRFYGKCPCDLKMESYSLSRMHVLITQTNHSHELKTVKYFCKGVYANQKDDV